MTRAADQPHEAAFRALLDAAGIRCVRAADGELLAPGRRGYVTAHDGRLLSWSLIHERPAYGPDGRLLTIAVGRPPSTRYGPWPKVSSRTKDAAKEDRCLQLRVECDCEAEFLFEPAHLAHVARRWCRCRFRRRLSPDAVERLRERGRQLARTSRRAGPRLSVASERQAEASDTGPPI